MEKLGPLLENPFIQKTDVFQSEQAERGKQPPPSFLGKITEWYRREIFIAATLVSLVIPLGQKNEPQCKSPLLDSKKKYTKFCSMQGVLPYPLAKACNPRLTEDEYFEKLKKIIDNKPANFKMIEDINIYKPNRCWPKSLLKKIREYGLKDVYHIDKKIETIRQKYGIEEINVDSKIPFGFLWLVRWATKKYKFGKFDDLYPLKLNIINIFLEEIEDEFKKWPPQVFSLLKRIDFSNFQGGSYRGLAVCQKNPLFAQVYLFDPLYSGNTDAELRQIMRSTLRHEIMGHLIHYHLKKGNGLIPLDFLNNIRSFFTVTEQWRECTGNLYSGRIPSNGNTSMLAQTAKTSGGRPKGHPSDYASEEPYEELAVIIEKLLSKKSINWLFKECRKDKNLALATLAGLIFQWRALGINHTYWQDMLKNPKGVEEWKDSYKTNPTPQTMTAANPQKKSPQGQSSGFEDLLRFFIENIGKHVGMVNKEDLPEKCLQIGQ